MSLQSIHHAAVNFNLRDYQIQAEDTVRAQYIARHRAVMLVMPTGSGKTRTFCSAAYQAAAKGRRVLILVHRKNLLKQTSRALEQLGIQHGLIAAGMSFNPFHSIQVASVQTLVRRVDRIDWQPNFIIVDEAHHATETTAWGQILNQYPAARILGVTATPQRLDGRGLGRGNGGFFDSMVIGPSVKQLTQRGFLSPAMVYAPKTRLDLSNVSVRNNEYSPNQIAELMGNPSIVGDAVSHYQKHCHQQPAIAFCASVQRAEEAAVVFAKAGYRAASITGLLNDRECTQRINDLGNGQLDVLTACEMISEGTDIPVVSAAILLRPTKSLSIALQQMGRALRPFPGKTHATILDHVGNVFEHGMPDDDRDWSLDAKPKRAKSNQSDASPVKQCDRCFTVHSPAPICPQCGFVYPVNSRVLMEIDGELERVTEIKQQQKHVNRQEQSRARSLDELIELARRRGYKYPTAWAQKIIASREQKYQLGVAV